MPGHTPERGFSLTELLFIVAIVGTLAGVAIPSLVAAREAALRSSVAATLRTVGGLQQDYHLRHGRYARLCPELNAVNAALGQCAGARLARHTFEFQMSPLQPSDAELAEGFCVLASGRGAGGSLVVLLTDESGAVSQLLP
jgi:type II secretory pathway pseudopilin PulG